jgi:hypothetical protein
MIGLAKSGTSSLYYYLGQHPQIYLSPVRSPNFWGLGEQADPTYGGPVKNHTANAPTLTAYQALFRPQNQEIALGEGSSFFNFTQRAAERIYQYIPDARLIVQIRQPAERAYSQYLYARRMGWEPAATFQAALDDEARRISAAWFPFLCYRHSSLMATTLRAYYADFPKEQMHVSLFDDFRRDPASVVTKLYQFLGVDNGFVPDVHTNHNPASVGLFPWLRSKHNNRMHLFWRFLPGQFRHRLVRWLAHIDVKPPPLAPALRTALTNEFYPDICATQDLIGQDLSHWLV